MEALGRAARAIARFERAYGRTPRLGADDFYERVLASASLAITALACPEHEASPEQVAHLEDLLGQIAEFEPRLTEAS